MDDDEFVRLNARRRFLIAKEHSGFTPEEGSRRFDLVPGWRSEFERRCRANLTDDERVELAQLERVVADEMNRRFPLPRIHDGRIQ